MTYFTIYESNRYRVQSSRMGDVIVKRLTDNARAYFQTGDDANDFLGRLEALQENSHRFSPEGNLDWYIAQYDDVMHVGELTR